MKISTDGFIDLRTTTKVRTPGYYELKVDPMPDGEAMAFLLSHSFPGHRRIVRPLRPRERRKLRRASWAHSVNDRMNLVDRVWRDITAPVPPPSDPEVPELIQIVCMEGEWAYPIYLAGAETRVIPTGGAPFAELKKKLGTPMLDLRGQRAS